MCIRDRGKGKGADGTPDTGYCIWTFEKGKVKTFTAIGADTDLWVKMRKGESVEGKGTNLPTFEPHDDPASLFWPVFQEWGKGTFAGANPELSKQAAMEAGAEAAKKALGIVKDSFAGPPEVIKGVVEWKHTHGTHANYKVWGEILATWGTGGFNIPDQKDANFEKFFCEDCVTDVSSGAYADAEKYKVYKGRAGAAEWFDFLGNFDFGPAPKFEAVMGADGESVVQKWTSVVSWKEGGMMGKGKGADGTPDTGYCIWTFEKGKVKTFTAIGADCLLYTSPSPRDATLSRMPSSA